MTYNEFKNEVLGKAYDVDGYYGAQCWDLYAYYSKKLGIPICHCPLTGYVQDIYAQRKTNGILKYCDEVETLQPGDIVIFRPTAGITPWSHIALFDHDAGGGYGAFLGQNQGATGGAANIVNLPYSATYTYGLRPKALGTVKVTNTTYEWDPDAVLAVGDVVKSGSCAITGVVDNMVNVPDLGGMVPLCDVKEASNSGDGAVDDVLSTTDARVWLKPCTVEQVDAGKNLVMVHGYWVKPDRLYKRI